MVNRKLIRPTLAEVRERAERDAQQRRNPQPNDLVPRGRLVMHGVAFDRAAADGSGVDKVSVFLDDRDAGGQHLGDAKLGEPNAAGFSVSADLSRASGKHTLFVYARSSVSGKEAVLSFPISVGSR